MQTPDVVVLVPGFLGFTRFGGFYYFADRLIAVLRGLLEEPLGYPVPVVPVTTLPTNSLKDRQEALFQNLAGIADRLPGVQRFHLIGHSTGGVDAQLLACTKNFEGHAWDKKANAVRKRIKSVVTISAPHYGTGLADSRLARWGENPLRHPTAILPEVQTLIDLLLLVPRDLAATAGFDFAAPNDVLKFMGQIARNRDLIEDLKPERMEAVRARLTSDPEIALTCFVTGTMPRDDSTRPSDPFFRDMYRLTQGSESVSYDVLKCDGLLRTLVQEHPDLVIRSGESHMPVVSPTLNDGVVNTVRQIVNPDRPDQVGGFVVADHGDVLGHYDRQDALIGGRPYNAGLFHSGAAFGDDEFFGLHRRAAQAILKAVRSPCRGEQPPKRSVEDVSIEVVSIWDGEDQETDRLADLELTFHDYQPPRDHGAREALLAELGREIQSIADVRFGPARVRIDCVRIIPGSIDVLLSLGAAVGSAWLFFKEYKDVRGGILLFASDVRAVSRRLTGIVAKYGRQQGGDHADAATAGLVAR